MPYEELVRLLPGKVQDSKILYYMDTLTYLQKGPNRTCHLHRRQYPEPETHHLLQREGVYYTVAKIRGSKQGMTKLLAEAKDFAGDGPYGFPVKRQRRRRFQRDA